MYPNILSSSPLLFISFETLLVSEHLYILVVMYHSLFFLSWSWILSTLTLAFLIVMQLMIKLLLKVRKQLLSKNDYGLRTHYSLSLSHLFKSTLTFCYYCIFYVYILVVLVCMMSMVNFRYNVAIKCATITPGR